MLLKKSLRTHLNQFKSDLLWLIYKSGIQLCQIEMTVKYATNKLIKYRQ